jgi:transcriptional regulator with XRE-family HTH domain
VPERQPLYPLLPARLRQARRELGLTQALAAAQVGVGLTAWNNWETGYRAPRGADELRRVCDLLRADPAWLLGLTDVRRPWPLDRYAPPYQPALPGWSVDDDDVAERPHPPGR